MHINCCNANGPRGFVMIPKFSVTTNKNELFINFYGESTAEVTLDNKAKINISQTTRYPEEGQIDLVINPESPVDCTISLRIPSWSSDSEVTVNGTTMEKVIPGAYLSISRTWSRNDKISISLDMRGRVHENIGHQAITRGPIVLARDSRFGDGFVDETAVIQQEDDLVELTPIEDKPEHVWMAFTAPCRTGTDLEGMGKIAKPIRFCDFASAGNTWDPQTRYRVWIRKTLNVMNRKYEGY